MAAFATPAELSTYTRGAVPAADPRSQAALDGGSAAIRNYCGWHIAPVTTSTVTLNGSGGRLLSLPTKMLVSIASLAEDAVVLVDSVDFRWSEDGDVKRKGASWSDEFRIIAASFTHGYAEAADVKEILLAMVARELSSPTGATREQAGAMSVSWALTAPGVSGGVALLKHERDILDFYRIVTV